MSIHQHQQKGVSPNHVPDTEFPNWRLTSGVLAAIVVAVALDDDGVAPADAAPLPAAAVIAAAAAAERPAVGARVGEGPLRELLAQKVCLGRELGKE